jgi:hypothetical protein
MEGSGERSSAAPRRQPRPRGADRPRFDEIRLGDVGRGLTRLSPFLAAVGAALLLVVVPPNGHGALQAASSGAQKHFQLPTEGTPNPASDAAATAAPASTSGPQPPGPTADSAPSLAVAPATSIAAPVTSAPAVAAPEASVGDATVSPSADQTAVTPLTVAAKAWASRDAGTPLASTDVPAGTLPVGNRLGQLDKASFVRLSGTATTLTLTADPSGARNLAGAGSVQACPVTASWTAADAMALDQAPAYDTTKCVAGTHPDDSTWSFDLGAFADRAGGNGFALVPAPDAPVDFQVAFKAG